tara:strand:- start:445 stop:711 length:267 start_codon:yes stop_codon:yes gene_type:complete
LENKKSKNTVDKNKKNFGVITREWKKGDLVKVMDFDITGLPSPYYGVVLGDGDKEQMKIFPCLSIYSLSDARSLIAEVYKLELISAAR